MPALPILTVTLNPALDMTTGIDHLEPQRKLRCGMPRYDPGGGGVNVSRAIRILGGDSRAFVALAGATGELYRKLLAETGIETELWSFRGETRISLTVMEGATGLHYRFVLPGPEQAPADAARLMDGLAEAIARTGVRYVVASGSVPPGLPVDFYTELTRRARIAGAALILDTSGPHLKDGLGERPFLVRLNHLEAQDLVGGDTDEVAVARAAALLRERNWAEAVIITLGANGAFVAGPGVEAHIRPPPVPVVSMVGAGDSFIGALVLGLVRGWPLDLAARFGVAAAASAVTTPATQLCEREATERYFEEIDTVTESGPPSALTPG